MSKKILNILRDFFIKNILKFFLLFCFFAFSQKTKVRGVVKEALTICKI